MPRLTTTIRSATTTRSAATVWSTITAWSRFNKFNKLKDHIVVVKDGRLKTNLNDFNYMKGLIKGIANNEITKDDAINKVKEDSAHIDVIKRLREITTGIL